MSVNTTFKLTREEVKILADYWLSTYETLSDEDYEDDKIRGLVVSRTDHYEMILDDLVDNDSPINQLKRI